VNRHDGPLPPVFKKAASKFKKWSKADLSEAQARNKITASLYHYTDAAGLEGIVKNQQVWFTSHAHLNDPTENPIRDIHSFGTAQRNNGRVRRRPDIPDLLRNGGRLDHAQKSAQRVWVFHRQF
jgi:hypothetical protein